MLVDELKNEILALNPPRLTKVVLGGSFEEPERIEISGGELIIGAELDSPTDHDCEEECGAAHLLDANVDVLVAFLAGIAQPDAAQLTASAKRSLEDASIDDLTHWLAHREAERQHVRDLAGQRRSTQDTKPL